jgi:hypothetical protein
VNNPFDGKENDEHALDFAPHLSRLLSVSMSLDSSNGRIVALSQGHDRQSSSHLRIFFFRDLHKIRCTLAVRPIAISRLQIKGRRISMSTHLREILYTDSQDKTVLSSTVASRYNCISPGNYGCPLVFVTLPPLHATCPSHCIILGLTTLISYSRSYKFSK